GYNGVERLTGLNLNTTNTQQRGGHGGDGRGFTPFPGGLGGNVFRREMTGEGTEKQQPNGADTLHYAVPCNPFTGGLASNNPGGANPPRNFGAFPARGNARGGNGSNAFGRGGPPGFGGAGFNGFSSGGFSLANLLGFGSLNFGRGMQS